MRTLPWVRERLIHEIRSDLWRYLTPAANIETELLEAAALLQMSSTEVHTLGQLQFLISAEVGDFLQALPILVRRLATTTASEEEWSVERIRGAIQWGRTIGLRQATGAPHLYVTSPARRAYQTPENELLVLLLDAIVGLGRRSGWDRSEVADIGQLVRARVVTAERWLTTRALLEVVRRPMSPTKLMRIRSGRHRRRHQRALDAYERYRLLAERPDRRAIQKAVETYGLISRSDPTLFELICVFRTIDALETLGWQLDRFGLFAGSLRLKGRRETALLELRYQSTPAVLSRGSAYRRVERAHGIAASTLLPDLVLKQTEHGCEPRWLLIEAKGGKRPIEGSARAATLDLLAYREDFADVLDRQAGPYGLGVAFGSDLAPNPTSEIMLCTPEYIPAALERFFDLQP